MEYTIIESPERRRGVFNNLNLIKNIVNLDSFKIVINNENLNLTITNYTEPINENTHTYILAQNVDNQNQEISLYINGEYFGLEENLNIFYKQLNQYQDIFMIGSIFNFDLLNSQAPMNNTLYMMPVARIIQLESEISAIFINNIYESLEYHKLKQQEVLLAFDANGIEHYLEI